MRWYPLSLLSAPHVQARSFHALLKAPTWVLVIVRREEPNVDLSREAGE
jgi:hypothetical protein